MIEGLLFAILIIWFMGAVDGMRSELKKSNKIKRD